MTPSDSGAYEKPPHTADILRSAEWFPVDLDVHRGVFSIARLGAADVGTSSFLDTRIETPCQPAATLSACNVPLRPSSEQSVAWLWHTSFCCSTLLARALHISPLQVSLKEPLILRRLGDARATGLGVSGLVQPCAALLARPWSDGGAVVIKPTHAALNVASDLMQATPRSRAVFLTSSLHGFLVSNLKKTVETQRKIPQLAHRALQATSFSDRLGWSALNPPDLLACAALQWAAQLELLHEIERSVGSERVRWLLDDELLGDVTGVVSGVAGWLMLPVDQQTLRENAATAASANAKATSVAYGPEKRRAEAQIVEEAYGDLVRQALAWAQQQLLPAMRNERAAALSRPADFTSMR